MADYVGTSDSHAILDLFLVPPDSIGQGSATRDIQGSSFMRGGVYNTDGADGDNFTWTVWLQAGRYKFYLQARNTPGAAIIDCYIDGNLVVDGNDLYSATQGRQRVESVEFEIANTGLHTFKVQANGKNASSSAYYFYLSQIVFIRTDNGGAYCPDKAILSIPPFCLDYSVVQGTWQWDPPVADSTNRGPTHIYNSSLALNDEITFDIWLGAGRYYFGFCTETSNASGQLTVSASGGDSDVLEFYYASAAYPRNLYTNTFYVDRSGKYTISLRVTGKHASSSGYRVEFGNLMVLRGSTEYARRGSGHGGMELVLPGRYAHGIVSGPVVPVNDVNAYSQWYMYNSGAAIGDQPNWILGVPPGVYDVYVNAIKSPNIGQYDYMVELDGEGNGYTSIGSVDGYSATNDWLNVDVYQDVVVRASGDKGQGHKITGKNASSTNYLYAVTAIQWRRKA